MGAAAIIPARDEEVFIQATIAAALAVPGVTRVLVVDDGSTDATAEAARAAGADVLERHTSGGKAAALTDGLRELGAGGRGTVLFLDADLGSSASEAAALLAPVLAGEADMTIAAFPPAPAGSGGFGLVKGLARWGIRTLGSRGFQPASPLSGQRALGPRAVAVALPLGSGYGVEVALTIRALRAGLRVLEVPLTMTHRHTGRDRAGFAHRGRQLVDVALTLAGLALEPRRAADATPPRR